MSTTPPPIANAKLPEAGDLLAGKYRVERVLGRGGMGIVYAAIHELLGQRVAVKVLLADGPLGQDAAARFLNEARAAARIQSDSVVRVMDVGLLDSGLPYMVMELLDGSDLSDVLTARGQLGIAEVADYALQALEAVAGAHAIGIVHRDLKPANLFLTKRLDGTSLVKVLDFGISKTTGPLGQSGSMTSTATLLGSPYYMSPEQLRSSKSVDARADIWSMGIILYELLTGAVPFEGESIGQLVFAIAEQDPAPLQARRPDVPIDLEYVILRCLKRKADERFASALELANALAPWATARGLSALERIRGIPVPRLSSPPPGATTTVLPGGTTKSQTNASWGTSQGSVATPTPAKRRVGAMIGIGAALLALGIGGMFAFRHFTARGVSSTSSAASMQSAPPADATTVPVDAAPTPVPTTIASSVAASPTVDPAASSSVTAGKSKTPRSAVPSSPTPRVINAAPSIAPYDPTRDTRR